MDVEVIESALPLLFWIAASGLAFVVSLLYSLGWLRIVLPASWAGFTLGMGAYHMYENGPSVTSVVLIVGGLVSVLGWVVNRSEKADAAAPFPLAETPAAVVNPRAHRVLHTARAFATDKSKSQDSA